MKIKYDKQIDALYISLKKGKYHHTKKITDSILVDVSKTGEVLGLEVLDAKQNIGKVKPGKLSIEFGPKLASVWYYKFLTGNLKQKWYILNSD